MHSTQKPYYTRPQINTHMKHILILMSALVISVTAYAGHKKGNATCTDDLIHWQNMIDKRTDAPLWQYSKDTQVKAVEQRVLGNWQACEELMEEALRAIRKPYPTE